MSKELDHPCKQTCSGWQQGFEKGKAKAKQSEQRLVEALQGIEQLIESGDLCRDISKDADRSHFVQQGLRITMALKKMQEALAEHRKAMGEEG